MCRDFAPAEAGVPACQNSADQAGEICTYCRLSTARRTNQGSPHPVWAERVQALVLGGIWGCAGILLQFWAVGNEKYPMMRSC